MHFDMIAKNIARAIQEPSGVLRWLKRKVAGKGKGKLKAKRDVAAATLAARLAEIRAAGHSRIALYCDHNALEATKVQLQNVELVWISSNWTDLRGGAQALNDIAPDSIDGVLLVGGDVSNNYRQVLRWLEATEKLLPVYWVAQNFEYCGGAAPIAADCTEADILIFNHFPDFFGQRDPLLVKVEVFDEIESKQKWYLMRPNESIRIRISEWLPDRRGTACVLHHCAHPRLTSGRHDRWRSTAIYSWGNSIAMAHSDSGFAGATEKPLIEHKIGIGSMAEGKVAFTMPNYNESVDSTDSKAQGLVYRRVVDVDRNARLRIDEAVFSHDGRKTSFDDFFGIKCLGNGGSFWFSFDNGNDARAQSLSANHSVRGEFEPRLKRPATDEAALFAENLAEHDVMLDPHALPVEAPGSPVEFGFEFDMNFPVLLRFRIHAFADGGRYLGVQTFEKKEPGTIYADALLDALDFDRSQVGLLMLSPDWIGVGADPRGRGAAGNLVARNRRTGDYDATEFQNSWRNLGFTIDGLPHWLSQDRMLAGRTNLLCGIAAEANDRIAVVCINGSGRTTYSNSAEVVIRVVAADGSEVESRIRVDAFCHRVVWLDETIPGWRAHLGGGFGNLTIQSLDADLNANVITLRDERVVAFQHMWGY